MAEMFKNYIDGSWVESKAGKTFENCNPANRHDSIGLFPASTPEDVNGAVQAAKKAFARWRLVPAPKRGEILYRVGELLRRQKEDIARGMTREMGKILKETRGDVQEGIDTAFYVAGEGRRLFGETTPSELPDKFAMSVRSPIGVCALITPWNFPMAIPTWKLFPALLCGNTVVLNQQGSALQLDGGMAGLTITEQLDLSNTGINSGGALQSLKGLGANTVSGEITLSTRRASAQNVSTSAGISP